MLSCCRQVGSLALSVGKDRSDTRQILMSRNADTSAPGHAAAAAEVKASSGVVEGNASALASGAGVPPARSDFLLYIVNTSYRAIS